MNLANKIMLKVRKIEICPKLTIKTLNPFVTRLSDIIFDALLDLVPFAI